MSTVEVIKDTMNAATTPAISPEFVETDVEFEERNDELVVDIVKFLVLNTQIVEVVVAI